MKIYLVSNNSLLDGLNYESGIDLESVRIIRSLSIVGEENARKISDLKELHNVSKIYSSFYSSALSSAKYLSRRIGLEINLNKKFNDCKVGNLGSKNMKMVKGLQDHDFNYKLMGGESLNEVGSRLQNEINKLLQLDENIVIFTHKRSILGYLLKYCNIGYNLDDSLILEFNNKQVYDDIDSEYDIYELLFENKILKDINII